MIGFLSFTIASAAIFSALILSVPGKPYWYYHLIVTIYNTWYKVLLGRTILSLFGIFSAPEIYTAAIGFYLIWALIKCIATLMQYATAGMRSFMSELLKWSIIVCILGLWFSISWNFFYQAVICVIDYLLEKLISFSILDRAARLQWPVLYSSLQYHYY